MAVKSPRPIIMEFDNVPTQVYDCKNLHNFLEVQLEFESWIKDRIFTYQFIENEDFVFRNDIWYANLNMVKELCLIENTVEGRALRRHLSSNEKSKIDYDLIMEINKAVEPTLNVLSRLNEKYSGVLD